MATTTKNIRFYITENCNAHCKNCFNSNLRTGKEMSISVFTKLCDYFSSNGVSHIKIMGGEPTIHSQFTQFVQIAQEYFEEVTIFTNAINNIISSIYLRTSDKIVYNFKFAKAVTSQKLLLNQLGKRALEVQVLKDINIENIKNEILRIFNLYKSIEVYLTLDCTSDIFSERDLVIPIYEELQSFCKNHNIKQGQDHILPLCYVRGSHIPLPKTGALCSIECSGLIDAHYNIRFCNQHPQILGNMFDNNQRFIAWENLVELLNSQFNLIHNRLSLKQCKDCDFWGIYCNGGCFIK